MDTPIAFRGKITREIYCLTQTVNSGLMQRMGTVLPAILVVYGIFLWSVNRELKFLIMPLVIAIFIFVLRKYILMFINGLRYGNTSYYEYVFAGELNSNGLLFKDDDGELAIAWSEITRLKSGPGLLLLYKGPNTFHVIHRSYFASEQAWTDAEQLVRNKVSNAA